MFISIDINWNTAYSLYEHDQNKFMAIKELLYKYIAIMTDIIQTVIPFFNIETFLLGSYFIRLHMKYI